MENCCESIDYESCGDDYVKIGSKVPDFGFEALIEGQAKKVKISDYKGKWLILFFYPADFTFICPTELVEMANTYEAFKEENAEVISISTDTVFAHKAWQDSSESIKKVKFPMGADTTHEICSAFGTLIEDEGLSLRGTFIIDPDGILKCQEIHDNSIGRSATELLRKLRAAKFVRAHGGEVCPASWQPGGNTLKPGMDLVGKL